MTALFAVVTEAVVAASRLFFLLSFPVHVFVLLSLWGGILFVAVVTGARFFAVIPVRVVYVLLSSPGRVLFFAVVPGARFFFFFHAPFYDCQEGSSSAATRPTAAGAGATGGEAAAGASPSARRRGPRAAFAAVPGAFVFAIVACMFFLFCRCGEGRVLFLLPCRGPGFTHSLAS